MDKVVIKAETRADIGKGSARSLRREGMLPAVLYAGGSSTPIKLQRGEIVKLIGSGAGEHVLIALELDSNNADRWVLVKDYQVDPIKNELLHVDFMEISLEKKIHITIPLIITKQPIGLKKGGIMQQQMREVEIECLPTGIPEGIEVDASSVDIGHSLHVNDLVIVEGARILANPEDVVLTVRSPIVEAEAAPEEEIKEPEVIKKAEPKEEESEKK